MEEKIKRINELAKKHKEEGLTEDELKEREELRKAYLQNFRAHFRERMESVKWVSQEEYEEYQKNTKKDK